MSHRPSLAVLVAMMAAGGVVSPTDAAALQPLLSGYVAVEAPGLPERLMEIHPDSAFSILIDRVADGDLERRMIDMAERLVPDGATLTSILEEPTSRMGFGNWPNRLQQAQAESTPWVVVLDLRFSYGCGGRCALWVEHARRVYFDASGLPVRIEGDSTPRWEVS